ncbi:unnamed protein product [Closterium sp. Yama58-4]|nr:unnamed protein product [Closterium sp. Yama58-4]
MVFSGFKRQENDLRCAFPAICSDSRSLELIKAVRKAPRSIWLFEMFDMQFPRSLGIGREGCLVCSLAGSAGQRWHSRASHGASRVLIRAGRLHSSRGIAMGSDDDAAGSEMQSRAAPPLKRKPFKSLHPLNTAAPVPSRQPPLHPAPGSTANARARFNAPKAAAAVTCNANGAQGAAAAEASAAADETRYYSVMYCPRKPHAKRKGPWSDGLLSVKGRACAVQNMDAKPVAKALVSGCAHLKEGSTLEVGKWEVEVMHEVPREQYLAGSFFIPAAAASAAAVAPAAATGRVGSAAAGRGRKRAGESSSGRAAGSSAEGVLANNTRLCQASDTRHHPSAFPLPPLHARASRWAAAEARPLKLVCADVSSLSALVPPPQESCEHGESHEAWQRAVLHVSCRVMWWLQDAVCLNPNQHGKGISKIYLDSGFRNDCSQLVSCYSYHILVRISPGALVFHLPVGVALSCNHSLFSSPPLPLPLPPFPPRPLWVAGSTPGRGSEPTLSGSTQAHLSLPPLPPSRGWQYIGARMRPHQVEGVRFMLEAVLEVRTPGCSGCVLADEMGELADEMGELADEMGELADEMGELADEMGELAYEMGELAVEMDELADEMVEMDELADETTELAEKRELGDERLAVENGEVAEGVGV